MSKLRTGFPLLVALIPSIVPVLNICWELAHGYLPRGWWWSTEIAGWPGFSVLEALFGTYWVPSNVTNLTISEHVFRWSVFVIVNALLWVLLIFGIWKVVAMEHARASESRP